jgi:hypothetical protein
MKYKVFYGDQPGPGTVINAPDPRTAAQTLFSEHPRLDDCRIHVERPGFFNFSIQQFHVSEFLDEQTRQLLSQRQSCSPTLPTAAKRKASEPGVDFPQSDVTQLLRTIIANQECQNSYLSSIKWGVIALTVFFVLIPLLVRSCSAN